MISDSPLRRSVYWHRDGADSRDSCSARFSSLPNLPLSEFSRSRRIDFSSKVVPILGNSLQLRSISLCLGLARATVVNPKRISSCRPMRSSGGAASLLKQQLGLNFISSRRFCMSLAILDFFCAHSCAMSICAWSSFCRRSPSWYLRMYRNSMFRYSFVSLPRQNMYDSLYFFSRSVVIASVQTGCLGRSLSGTSSAAPQSSSGYSGYSPKPPISGTPGGYYAGGFSAGGCPSAAGSPYAGGGCCSWPSAGFSGSSSLGSSYLGGMGQRTLGGLTSSLFSAKVAMLMVLRLYSLSRLTGFSSSLWRVRQ